MKSLANESSSDNALDGSDEKPDLACRNQFWFPTSDQFSCWGFYTSFYSKKAVKVQEQTYI